MANPTYPLENPDAAALLPVPATTDKILVYDDSANEWKISLVSELQAVSGWTV